MNLPAYPKYKPSGVEWLGDVPEHWTTIALRRISSRYAGGTPDRSNESYWDEGTIPWINSGAVNQGLIAKPSAFITEEAYRSSSARWVPKGALVMALAGQGKTKGMVAQTGIETTCNQSMAAICPSPPMEARYLYWLLASQYQHIRNMAGGEARDGLNLEILGAIPVLNAPPVEQRAIAAFLDRETARIDRLVARKRELIERLKEKRTALISRTVTRGLPPAAARAAGLPENPTLKETGVPWIGACPQHWEVRRLRHVSDFIAVGVVVNPSSYFTDDGVPFLLGGDVREMRINLADCKRCAVESSDGPLVKSRLDAGDVVVVRVGYPGVAAVVPPAAAGGNVASMMLIRRHKRFCSQWLAYAINSQVGRDQVELVQYGAAQKQFNISHAVDFAFPFPPLIEQTVIATYLDVELAKLDVLIARVEAAIERLQEYRIALVTAAVTGKVDVRGEVHA